MSVEIATKQDLENFKTEILVAMKKFTGEQTPLVKESPKKWLKSHQVQRMLGISPGTLQNLRINGTMPYTKIGGVIFYSTEDIDMLLKRNRRNTIK